MDKQMKDYIDTGLIANQLRNLRHITFEVTDRCNLNCKYCGYGDFYGNYDTRDEKGLSIEKTTLFLDYIVSYWNNPGVSPDKYIYIGFYGGEPLLNMELIKHVVNYLKKVVIPAYGWWTAEQGNLSSAT